jgi:HK97 family phage major capsid protein
MVWMAKDAGSKNDQLINQSKEPEVVKAVLEEINKMGDGFVGIKKNYDELRKEHEQLKGLLDRYESRMDTLTKQEVQKYTEAISTRQDALDTAISKANDRSDQITKDVTKRLDDIELSGNRRYMNGDVSAEDQMKMAQLWRRDCMVVRVKDEKGATWERVNALGAPNLEEFAGYVKAFESFIRRPGDERDLLPNERKSLTVGADPDGGFTVTPAMAAKIITRQYESDPLREMCATETITTGAVEWMADWGQAGFGWEGETQTGDETSTPDFKKVRIPVHVLYAKPKATQTLLEDSGINIETWLANHIARRYYRAEGAAFVSGDGVGKPRGFLTYSNYVTAGGTSEWARIEQVPMGHASVLTADGFNLVKYSLVEYYLNRGTWLMNRLTAAEAMRLKDGDGQYIWRPGLESNAPSTIHGLPLRLATSMPTVAAGALAVALADWKEAYMIVDRLGIVIQRDPYTSKPFVEFYTRKRVGGDVINFEAIKLGVVST